MSWKKNKLAVILAGIVLLAALTGAAFYVRNKTRQPVTMVYIPKVIDEKNDFWTSLLEGAKMAAEEYGVELTVMAGKSEDDYEGQIRKIREAIARNPDVILLSPTSYTEITEAAGEIKKAGIRLVLVDSVLDEEIQDALVSTDNFNAGGKMGQLLLEIMPENPVIGIVSHVQGSSTAMEREAGFRAAVGEYASCVVDTVYGNSNYEKTYEVTRNMLEKCPDINVIVGMNEYSAVGAARAVKDAGLTGQIKMVGFDNSLEEIQLLEEGVFQGIVVQKPFNMGYLGVEKSVALLKGERFPDAVDSGSELITKENMYEIENQKLLFPFLDS
ncbi:MAG: substrate-binding domain-containing protein [Candidatus Limivivens sp.]|nr:substrate-binding domain-containing protein [Candidatus Limivivens sp.]